MSDFSNFLSPGRKGHLVGIGGVSMSSLAEVLKGMGISVTGSDSTESHNVLQLREKGIQVFLGHRAENLAPDVDFVVRTAAVHDDNPEIEYARANDIPVFERTEAWASGSVVPLCLRCGKSTGDALCVERAPVTLGGEAPAASKPLAYAMSSN